MEPIWLKNYPVGVPAEVDISLYPSVVALFEESFAKHKNAVAYVCMDRKLTFGQLEELSRALGAFLQSKGMARGAPMAILMPTVLQSPVGVRGVVRGGYRVVN